MFSWIRKGLAHRRRSLLIDTATEQVTRLTPGSRQADRMLHGEALIITGVLAAIVEVVSGAWAKMDALAQRHVAAVSDIAALLVQIEQLPDRQHVVAPAHHGRPRQLDSAAEPAQARRHVGAFVSRMRTPRLIPEDAVYGDAVSTASAEAEHEELNARIASEDAAGQSRHHHHVARIWRWAARMVLFFDVVALSTLTIKLENVAFDAQLWHEQFTEQLQRLITAICFALFAAVVIAVISHQVGAYTWRYIHRTSPLLAEAKPSKRVLVISWGVQAGLSVLMGVAIFARLQHEAAGTHSGGSVGWCVALLIGVAGIIAPLAVGLVEALHSSPEVLRRAALARIVQAANHDGQALARKVSGRHTGMVELVQTGERLLADTRRRVDAERLPAHQAILILRSRHGYADEHAAAIEYPNAGGGFLPDLDLERQLAPLVELLDSMRAGTIAQTETGVTSSDDDTTAAPEATSTDTASSPVVAEVIAHNGFPVS
ncbi:MAG: hypothetical protein JST91_31335 [Actinobacteria bacterium]|nr:hypothetical protein [Actinomycetota bacterium]